MVTLPSIRRISQCGFEGESFTQAGANRLAEQVTQGWLQVVKYSSRTLFVTRILKRHADSEVSAAAAEWPPRPHRRLSPQWRADLQV